MKKVVVLSGAGISAESGLQTFRDAGGLWEGHNVMEVATPQAWQADHELVLNFYNQRRKTALKAQPNRGHHVLAELEEHFDVTVVTQNVDNLHERAGSSHVIHLHGNLFQSRSTVDENLVYDIKGWELNVGETCEKGSQLRPHIVWFGEMVPMMEVAIQHFTEADICIVVGTSLAVYPAAGLVDIIPAESLLFVVDPKVPPVSSRNEVIRIEEKASSGMEKVKELLLNA